ncbi:MAG TPA: energy transducer TonB [Longimicrobiales bacterium]
MKHGTVDRCEILRWWFPAIIAVSLLLLAHEPAWAQAAPIYSPSELTSLPTFESEARARALIKESYPAPLRMAGVTGKVQLQFVVGPDGRVEPETIKVLAATASALGDAAREVAKQLRFVPGKLNGKPVRTMVALPIVYSN